MTVPFVQNDGSIQVNAAIEDSIAPTHDGDAQVIEHRDGHTYPVAGDPWIGMNLFGTLNNLSGHRCTWE